MNMKKLLGVLVVLASAFLLIGAPGASAAKAKTVEISGRAFVFNHMSTGIPNATIKVREFPKLSATTDELGDYVLEVPDDANVTPYILSGGPADLVQRNMDGEPTGTMNAHWNEIDLQTFHTRGEDIENANFQAPRDEEYNGLKALLSVPAREDGRPEKCAIVTTASARNVRDVDFRTYWLNTPHGVEGATSVEYPAIPGPTYFNHFVIPDPNQPSTSNDGGIIWPIVPTGTYRIITTAPDARFASFLATCKPGRIVNANPPWGAYQLNPGERPVASSNVAARLQSVTRTVLGSKRFVMASVETAENIKVTAKVYLGGKVVGRKSIPKLKTKNKVVWVPIHRKARKGKGTLKLKLTDLTGVSFTTVKKVFIPKLKKKKKQQRR